MGQRGIGPVGDSDMFWRKQLSLTGGTAYLVAIFSADGLYLGGEF